jgi:hypothetical protein
MSKILVTVKNEESRKKVLEFFKTSPLTEFETCFKLRNMTFEMEATNLTDEVMLRNIRMELDILDLVENEHYTIINP